MAWTFTPFVGRAFRYILDSGLSWCLALANGLVIGATQAEPSQALVHWGLLSCHFCSFITHENMPRLAAGDHGRQAEKTTLIPDH